jgi:hypothetical protein
MSATIATRERVGPAFPRSRSIHCDETQRRSGSCEGRGRVYLYNANASYSIGLALNAQGGLRTPWNARPRRRPALARECASWR